MEINKWRVLNALPEDLPPMLFRPRLPDNSHSMNGNILSASGTMAQLLAPQMVLRSMPSSASH